MSIWQPAITLSAAMNDPQLLGGPFQAASFWTWKTVGKVIDGLPLDRREAALFKEATGRTYNNRAARRAFRRLVILVGRRGGKDRFLSAVACWRAALCADWRQYMSAGEQGVVLLLGLDRKQAAILRRYCLGLLEAPLLAAEVERVDADVVTFKNGAALEIGTNSAALIRGRSAIAVLGSECCHWRTDEAAMSSDEEVIAAAEPSMAMIPDNGLLLLGSSVYAKRGYMYRRFKELHGNDDAEDLCWFAPSRVMNPKLPQRVVDKAMGENPSRAGAEYLNLWRESVADFVPADSVEAATDADVVERPPVQGVKYFAFADSAGGTGRDSFALAIAHKDADDIAVLDLVRERKPRFVPSSVVAELAALLRMYGITEIYSDAYAGGFHSSEWLRNFVTFKPSSHTTSENFLHLLPMLLSGRVRLVNSSVLRSQLIGLERHIGTAGHETVGHRQVSSAHDDVAAAAAGALVLAGTQKRNFAENITPELLNAVASYRYKRPGFGERPEDIGELEHARLMQSRGGRGY